MTDELSKDHWEKQALAETGYSKVMNRAWGEGIQKIMHDEQTNAIRELGIWADAEVLDIGCGMGRLTEELAKMGINSITGLDISEEMIAFAEEICSDCNNTTFAQQDLKDGLPYKDNSFDVVFEWSVLLHILQDESFTHILQEMGRVSKKYVVLGIDNPDKEERKSYFVRRTRQQHRQPLLDMGYKLISEKSVNDNLLILALFRLD